MAKDNTSAKAQLPPPPAPPFNIMAVINRKLDDIGERLGRLEEKEVPEVKLEQILYSYNLAIAGAPGSQVTLMEYAPFKGFIKEVTPHWPLNCNALVDIRVGHGVTQFCPREGFLALNDATPSYPFNEPVDNHEEIWVEMINTDGGFTHNITVTVTIEEA